MTVLNRLDLVNEDWELVNDDGFVYKRLRLHPTTTTNAAAPPTDPAAEERSRRERKKTILFKLKSRYQQEILHWELLSNTLKALQNCPQTQPPATMSPDQPVDQLPEHSSDSAYREIAEDLLFQVEAQQATIREVSTLCDVAEALCSAREEWLTQPVINLPVWDPSPQDLITLLCQE